MNTNTNTNIERFKYQYHPEYQHKTKYIIPKEVYSEVSKVLKEIEDTYVNPTLYICIGILYRTYEEVIPKEERKSFFEADYDYTRTKYENENAVDYMEGNPNNFKMFLDVFYGKAEFEPASAPES